MNVTDEVAQDPRTLRERRAGPRRAAARLLRARLHRVRARVGARDAWDGPRCSAPRRSRSGCRRGCAGAARAGSPPSTRCCPAPPPSGPTARRPRASSRAGPRRSSASSPGRCGRSATWWRSVRARSPSTATSCRPTAGPGRRRSAAPTSRCTTRSPACCQTGVARRAPAHRRGRRGLGRDHRRRADARPPLRRGLAGRGRHERRHDRLRAGSSRCRAPPRGWRSAAASSTSCSPWPRAASPSWSRPSGGPCRAAGASVTDAGDGPTPTRSSWCCHGQPRQGRRDRSHPGGPAIVDLRPRPADVPDVDETGDDALENARLKARAIAAATGRAVGRRRHRPRGRRARRRPGRLLGPLRRGATPPTPTTSPSCCRLSTRLPDGGGERRARFVTVALVAFPDGAEVVAEGIVEGAIAAGAARGGGFGYDPVFVPDEGDGADLRRDVGDRQERQLTSGPGLRGPGSSPPGRIRSILALSTGEPDGAGEANGRGPIRTRYGFPARPADQRAVAGLDPAGRSRR